MTKPIKSHTFRERRYRIKLQRPSIDELGRCEHPGAKHKAIHLDPDLDGRLAMDTAIHEALHACFWWLSEEVVEKVATDIARFLWRLGYRQVK